MAVAGSERACMAYTDAKAGGQLYPRMAWRDGAKASTFVPTRASWCCGLQDWHDATCHVRRGHVVPQ